GDHWPDIFIANDSQPNRLWINQRDGTFKEEAVLRGVAYDGLGRVQANMGIAFGDVKGAGLLDLFVTHLTEETNTLWSQGPRGLAYGDIDGDGAVDLLVTRVAGSARLYRNVAPKQGHWLMIRAVDPALHRDAYGAEITVVSGERRWRRWLNPGSSYLCSNDPRGHFGLGEAARVDGIHVLWPDGRAEDFPGRGADRAVTLVQGKGSPAAPRKSP